MTACATTATATIVTSTSPNVSETSCAVAARSSCGEALKPDGVQQRRQEDEEDRLGRELDGGQAGHEPDRHAADDEHDRIRDRDEIGEPDEHRRREQDRDEELDVAHGERKSTSASATFGR